MFIVDRFSDLKQVSEDGLRCVSCRKGTYDVVGKACLTCPFGAECEGNEVRTVNPNTFVHTSVQI